MADNETQQTASKSLMFINIMSAITALMISMATFVKTIHDESKTDDSLKAVVEDINVRVKAFELNYNYPNL